MTLKPLTGYVEYVVPSTDRSKYCLPLEELFAVTCTSGCDVSSPVPMKTPITDVPDACSAAEDPNAARDTIVTVVPEMPEYVMYSDSIFTVPDVGNSAADVISKVSEVPCKRMADKVVMPPTLSVDELPADNRQAAGLATNDMVESDGRSLCFCNVERKKRILLVW